MTNIRAIGSTTRQLVTEARLCTWLGKASPGDTLEYHRGALVFDTAPYASRLSEHDRSELRSLARRAAWAQQQGLVHLVQKRHGTDDYSYLIVRAQMPPGRRPLPIEVAP
jgi:hypothetical protein